MLDWTLENLTTDEVVRLRSIYEPLTESVRALIDATIRTEVDADTVALAKAQIDAATARLRREQRDGPYGIRFTTDGDQMPWGNVVIGVRNPVAPPLVVQQSDSGVFTDFHLGAAYEGPPGHVHGGVSALLLDHALGVANHWAGLSGMTAQLTLRYHRPTPLFEPLTVTGSQVGAEGRKIRTVGAITAGGETCVSAEGLFIAKHLPRPR